MSGYLVRCTVCGREERTGSNPLRDGWPKCCGYTMRQIPDPRPPAGSMRRGWECPKCGAVMAPGFPHCVNCKGSKAPVLSPRRRLGS